MFFGFCNLHSHVSQNQLLVELNEPVDPNNILVIFTPLYIQVRYSGTQPSLSHGIEPKRAAVAYRHRQQYLMEPVTTTPQTTLNYLSLLLQEEGIETEGGGGEQDVAHVARATMVCTLLPTLTAAWRGFAAR